MEQQARMQMVANGHESMPVSYVPTPTREYRTHWRTLKVTMEPGMPMFRDATATVPQGARVLMWKQDPAAGELRVQKAYLPGAVLAGPRDARLVIQGLPEVAPNTLGDFIQTPGTDAFDAVHTFTVVRHTLNMYQRALQGRPLPWQWNSPSNTDPLQVFPHGLPDIMNAFYSRQAKALKFGDFDMPGTAPGQRLFTCRSLDMVAHATGHALLDGLQPGWLSSDNPPQTGGLHESFADMTAIFLALSQIDQVAAIVTHTKANLHDRSFLADLAEELGMALGRPNGLRNADNDLKLSQVGSDVHKIAQVFTGATYDVLADIFDMERKPTEKDDALALYEAGQYVCSLLLRAILAAPASRATFADVANQMLRIVAADGKPAAYRDAIGNRFASREVVEVPAALSEERMTEIDLAPLVQDAPEVRQNRCSCCGTMQLGEYTGGEKAIQAELEELTRALAKA